MNIKKRIEGRMIHGSSMKPVGLSKKKTLLVIDVDYRDHWRVEDMNNDLDRRRAADSIVKKVSWARENNLPIIFIMLEREQMTQVSKGSRCIGCDRENKLPDFLEHKHAPFFEPVFVKTLNNAFSNPNLAKYLNKIGAMELLLVGYNTFACVADTAKGAIRAGFDVNLLEDAVYPSFKYEKDKTDWLELVSKSIPSGSRQNVAIIKS